MEFGERIVAWYLLNKRDLPWRNTNDPYKIWLSEVLLQQTRVDQGLSYYIKFIEAYPKVNDLASANEEEVLNLWQGLGYYSRARNLHFAAKQVIEEFSGVFPVTYKEIKTLKGVGDYTASAVASIAFNENVAVVDGNVYRVLSRYLSISTPIDTGVGQKEFKEAATALLRDHHPGNFNQAMMELGALVCSPKNPSCSSCPLMDSCSSFAAKTMSNFPVKSKKIKQVTRYFNYLVIENKQHFYLEKRLGKGIWENMYQFPLIETDSDVQKLTIDIADVELVSNSDTIKHVLSHQIIFAKFWEYKIASPLFKPLKTWVRLSLKDLEDKPLPKLIDNYISKRYF